jgi:hypothetical protein
MQEVVFCPFHYELGGHLDFDESVPILIPLRDAMDRHKASCALYRSRFLERIKEVYMEDYTAKTGQYDVVNIERDLPRYGGFQEMVRDWPNIQKRIESNYPLPDNWDQVRTQVITRDNRKCVLCGDYLEAKELHVHHIAYRARGGSHHPRTWYPCASTVTPLYLDTRRWLTPYQ